VAATPRHQRPEWPPPDNGARPAGEPYARPYGQPYDQPYAQPAAPRVNGVDPYAAHPTYRPGYPGRPYEAPWPYPQNGRAEAEPAVLAGPGERPRDQRRSRRRLDASPWHWLLLVPIAIPLMPFLYNREEPMLGGVPFFYWGQLSFALIASAVVTIVHLATKAR
jgi:hypothetical protein